MSDLVTLQEIYFDLCDLINSDEINDIAFDNPEEFSGFETVKEFLIEQRNKLEPFTASDSE